MSRRWLLSLLCLSAAVLCTQLTAAKTSLHVNEAATKLLIQDQTIVALEVVNPDSQNVLVRLKLDLLDPKDQTRGLAVRDENLKPGVNRLAIPLSLHGSHFNAAVDDTLPWYRIRYRIDPLGTGSPEATAGVISLSQIDTPNIFALEVSAPRQTNRGASYYVHVRAFHPVTAKPVKDVNISAQVTFDLDQKTALKSSAITDSEGYALVGINIPSRLSSDEGDVAVVARHGGYLQKTEAEVDVGDEAQILITTDKSIYQPGQPLHVRALVFNSNNRAAANAGATLKIRDPESTTVFQTTLQTSRFGVVSADWTIPENTRLGHYFIDVEMDDENYGESRGSHAVKISRYDLPNFTVNVKPDRSYYLPHQHAGVEVRGDYLFGQPLKRGHVRIVREQERHWNFREQKWETEEGETFEGETDEAGRFIAKIDLKKDHERLAGEDYSRFRDLRYAAYFTDHTTNRTEQRRFDLRVTKDAIHIYIAEGRYQQARGIPLAFYVATSYADGSPAECEVVLSLPPGSDDEASSKLLTSIQSIRTNKYGVAKVTGLKLPEPESGGNAAIHLNAADSAGRSGRHTESFYYSSTPTIRVETDKALYRPGENLQVSITASQPEMNVIVDVASQSNLIQSRHVQLHQGKTTFTVRYKPEMRDEVNISAYSQTADSNDWDLPFGSRTVLFPRDRELRFNVRMDRAKYKPGADAMADFEVLRPDGKPASSVIGVVIFDRAVEERARLDEEFGGRFGFYDLYCDWRAYNDQVGGFSRKDLQRIDLSRPIPGELEIVAEMLLGAGSPRLKFFNTDAFNANHLSVFADLTRHQIQPIEDFLNTRYKEASVYPVTTEAFRRMLLQGGIDFDQVKDPWDQPYRKVFSTDGDDDVLNFMTSGPDKQFGTRDDFSVTRITRPYFRFTGEAIDRAVHAFHTRTGGFIRDASTFKTELKREGVDFETLRDPWGHPYDCGFTTSRTRFNVEVRSGGPNQHFEESGSKTDDFTIWLAGIDYTVETRARVEKTLGEYFRKTNSLPRNDGELNNALAEIAPHHLRDPWGHRYYAVYGTQMRYVDSATLQSFASYGQKPKEPMEIKPVTQHIGSIYFRSSGEDGKEGTPDDFEVARFSQLTGEQSARDQSPVEPAKPTMFAGAKGAIKGTVTDPSGAVVPGVTIKATLKDSSQFFETQTDTEGRFILQNIPAGYYEVRCEATGFQTTLIAEVPVRSSNVTTLDLTLQIATASATVTVTAEGSNNMVTDSATAQTIKTRVSVKQPIQISTPRLREYFPETLVWQPSLETDKQGRARLKFRLADNITTWKMSVIGSTEDGELGTAETEFKAFQPFFAEHDPPRVLTEGDQISLPVVLRNYLDRAQAVDLEMKPENWFAFLGPSHRRAIVPAGDSTRETFDLKAVASIKDGKQRVTAIASEANDAIEKPVTVRPDGEEIVNTVGDVFTGTATFNVQLPDSVIPNSTFAEVKLYPNLMAHVAESIEGIMQRPYGCGEQTISATYPSLLMLAYHEQVPQESRIVNTAQRYAQLGYQRLLNYRTEDGGFSYWGRGDAHLALTAYALRFLHDAGQFVSVDDEVIDRARQWLIKRQSAEGSWPASEYNYDPSRNRRQTALLTAFVARILAMTSPPPRGDGSIKAKQNPAKVVSPAVTRALVYLSPKVEQIDEPYLIASYGLAAIHAGDQSRAENAIAKLRSLAHTEGHTSYWALEANTPFYGWGLAGRVETTALVVETLARHEKSQSGQPAAGNQLTDSLVRKGLLFLLKQKDRYGVWYSTQATVNVLNTLVTLLATEASPTARTEAPVEIHINGQLANSIKLPPSSQTAGLVRIEISRFLRSGANHIELRRSPGSAVTSVQLVTNYYVPWPSPETAENAQANTSEQSSLRLAVSFEKRSARINEDITCQVKVERVGFRGYGMMLAEIGLPPGSDVDRASLETAMKGSNWAVNQYDVLPDRVVFYLWPGAGGVDFAFKFRPRFAMSAKSPPSVVTDYYNPEARALIVPAKFVVQ